MLLIILFGHIFQRMEADDVVDAVIYALSAPPHVQVRPISFKLPTLLSGRTFTIMLKYL